MDHLEVVLIVFVIILYWNNTYNLSKTTIESVKAGYKTHDSLSDSSTPNPIPCKRNPEVLVKGFLHDADEERGIPGEMY